MFQSRILLRLGLALALVLTLGAGRASADIEVYDLTTSNLGTNTPPFTGPFASVSVDLTTDTTATITFQSLADANFTYLFHSGGVGVNVNATSWNVTGITASNSYESTYSTIFNDPAPSDGGYSNFSSNGAMKQSISLHDGFMQAATTISFTVTDTSSTWANVASVLTPNSDSQIAAAQIGAWVVGADKFANNGTSTGFAGDAQPTPEPSTMVIGGLAALGFIGYGLRKRFKR